MDRRMFLTRLPAVLAGTAAGLRPGDASARTRRERVVGLLEAAEGHYAQAHELLHYPHRYHEARPILEAALEAAAEAWLLHRGVRAKAQPHYTWLYMAHTRSDEITGIAWRGAHAMLCRMREDCDHMPRFFARDVSMQVRCTMIGRSRGSLVLALNNVAQCIEGARREALHGLPATRGCPLPHTATPAERMTDHLSSVVDECERRIRHRDAAPSAQGWKAR